GRSLFWEDYGYVGAVTFLLAVLCVLAGRRRSNVGFVAWMALVAYLLVLGPLTPVFAVAYYALPGLKLFRVPNRFLIVTDLGIAILGGVGLTLVCEDVRRRHPRSWLPTIVGVGVCLVTAADLFVHQPRQNPVVAAGEWLAPPATVGVVQA